MKALLSTLALAVVRGASSRAAAIPRFAARNGNECIQCHVSPTGGGVRNAYGRNVFERIWLPMGRKPAADDWVVRPRA